LCSKAGDDDQIRSRAPSMGFCVYGNPYHDGTILVLAAVDNQGAKPPTPGAMDLARGFFIGKEIGSCQ